MRSQSTDKELVTIALIPPTVLKTRMDDDDDDDDDEHSPYPLAPTHIPSYPCRPRDPNNGRDGSPYGAHDSPVELVYVPPPYGYSATESEDMVEEGRQTGVYEASLTSEPQLSDQPIVVSLSSVIQAPVVQREHSVDSVDPTHSLVDSKATGIPPRVEGASSVTVDWSVACPEVIVSSSSGHSDVPRSRSHSRSRSRSRSRTPSPNDAMTSSTKTASPSSTTGGAFLAPSDPAPSRGRSASSSSLSSQAQVGQSRGRSITRTPSSSDRESLNTGSPDGNVGLGIGSVGVRDRERDVRAEKEGRRSMERGRDPGTRRSSSHSGSNSSLSPEHPHAAAHVTVEQPRSEQLPVPEVRKKYISASSSSGSSFVTVVPTTRSPPRLVLDAKPIAQTSYTGAPSTSIPISPSCAQEEQESISRQPTPANSPILSMCSPPSPSKSSPHPPIVHHERRSSGGSRSPSRNGDDDGQQGTLVGRAVEIMSNAGAFLGSFWPSGAVAGVPTS